MTEVTDKRRHHEFEPSVAAAGRSLLSSRQCSLAHALPQVSDHEDTPEGP